MGDFKINGTKHVKNELFIWQKMVMHCHSRHARALEKWISILFLAAERYFLYWWKRGMLILLKNPTLIKLAVIYLCMMKISYMMMTMKGQYDVMERLTVPFILKIIEQSIENGTLMTSLFSRWRKSRSSIITEQLVTKEAYVQACLKGILSTVRSFLECQNNQKPCQSGTLMTWGLWEKNVLCAN